MTTTIRVRPASRVGGAWAAAHRPVPGVPRWARNAACAVPYTVLPASLWRTALCTFHVPIGRGDIGSGLAPSGVPGVPLGLYVIVLSALMDVRMPRVDGITATRLLGQFDGGGPAVIVVTTFENDDYVYDALQAGARGFLLKRSAADDYVNAIRTVHEGESLLFPAAIRRLVAHQGGQGGSGLAAAGLTEREEEVLRLVAITASPAARSAA